MNKPAKHPLADLLDGPVGAGLPDAPRRGVNRYKLVHDWDGTIVPEIKGNAAEYLRGLDSLQPGDESQLAREAKGPITILTARPPMFHGKIRETGKRLGLDIGEIHHGGFDKVDKLRELNGILVDNNEDVADGITKALGAHRVQLVPTHTKRADNFLQRWLSLHAARDAANMEHPTGDAISAKLGGPLSLGAGEAISNRLTLGSTFKKRHKTLTKAVENVEDEDYGDTLKRGLKSAPTYAAVGAGAGALSALAPSLGELRQGQISPHTETGPIARRALIGALLGGGASMARPLLQKAVLDRASHHAKRKAINIKAEHPTLTSLPGGDIAAALLHPGTKAAAAFLEGGIGLKLLQDGMEQPEKTPEEIEADKPSGRGPDLDQLQLVDRRKRRPSVNDPLINELERMMAARRAKREQEAL